MNGPNVTEEPVRLEGFGPKDLYQRREKIFTRFVGGFFQRLRFFTGWPLLTGYFLLPWINWGERQAVLFDLPAREFHIFTLTFFPQDFWLLGWLLMIAAFGLFTVTTVVGRLWCGYTCPQTVWTAIFMWAEQVAEGPRHARIRLEQAPWSFEKLRKRAAKHSMWIGFAALTGVTFVGYFTPIRELVPDLTVFEASGWAVFWSLFFTGATYTNAGWMREQVCIYMCPYARFQSAMFDKDTLIVSYDASRGEPRGSRKRSADAAADNLGDCIDCQLCVQVCPVGIDIRDGLQYECIGCAHCIDACDQVMDKMDYPRGLVRYTTEHELSGGKTHWFRGRAVGYAVVLLVLMTAFTVAIFSRKPFEVDVIRERGELFQVNTADQVVNPYSLKVLNKTQGPQRYTIEVVSDLPLTVERSDQLAASLASLAAEVLDLPLILSAPREAVALPTVPVTVRLCEVDSGHCDEEQTTFFGPVQ
ncbi:MAG: cytochrome c oxidase accessory protein CcoG [Pseudomonadota bacterium]